MTDFTTIREKASRWLVAALVLHVPFFLGVSLVVGVPYLLPVLGTTGVVAVVAGTWWQDRSGPATRYIFAVGAAFMPAMLVYLLRGHPWQIDMHIYFFATLAIVTVLCDWRAIVVGATTIALHHLILNFALPAAVFPDGTSLGRVIVHAVVVVLEAGALIWLSTALSSALASARSAIETSEAARQETETARREQERVEAEAAEDKRKTMTSVAETFERDVAGIVRNVNAQVERLDSEAYTMQGISEETRSEATNIKSAADEANDSVQAVTAATEQLRASIQNIAQQSTTAVETVRAAEYGAKSADKEVRALEEAVQNIGSVVELIQDIAEQTNLLALNATIESARAGEAGKGFAVVANEVKSLANQTHKATEDISGRIGDVQARTTQAVDAINGVTSRIGDIEESITTVTSAIEEQEAATREIAQSVDGASTGVESVTQRMGKMGDVASRGDTASASVVHVLKDLAGQTGDLDAKVADFLKEIRNT